MAYFATGRIPGQRFAGFKIPLDRAKIHAALRFGEAPMTESQIVEATDVSANVVKAHCAFWGKREYLASKDGWAIDPEAIFEQEWFGGRSPAEARWWWETVRQPKRD